MKLGELIDRGDCRNVYKHPKDENLVVKVTKKIYDGVDSNKLEWEIWNLIKDTRYAKYFCPCVDFIDEKYLIMQRCDKLKHKNEDKIYVMGFYVRDSKVHKNKGLLNGETVILDYGHRKNVKFVELLNEKLR